MRNFAERYNLWVPDFAWSGIRFRKVSVICQVEANASWIPIAFPIEM
jgi:hypothetical protein